MNRDREHAAFFLRRGAGRLSAAVLIAAVVAISAAPSQPVRADAIPARSVLPDRGGDGSRMPVGRTTAGKAGSARVDAGGVSAASAHPANAPQRSGNTGEPFDFVPTLRPTLHPLFDFDQFAPVALQLFSPTASGGGSLVQLALTDTRRGYLAQIAPAGLDTLREARCAAAVPRPSGCEKASERDGLRGGLLSGLSFATIPIPSAGVLLLAALVCLGAVAWRKRRLGL